MCSWCSKFNCTVFFPCVFIIVVFIFIERCVPIAASPTPTLKLGTMYLLLDVHLVALRYFVSLLICLFIS